MNTFISQSPELLLGIGIGLSAVGVIIWKIPEKWRFDENRSRNLSLSGRLIFSAGLLAIIAGVWAAL